MCFEMRDIAHLIVFALMPRVFLLLLKCLVCSTSVQCPTLWSPSLHLHAVLRLPRGVGAGRDVAPHAGGGPTIQGVLPLPLPPELPLDLPWFPLLHCLACCSWLLIA